VEVVEAHGTGRLAEDERSGEKQARVGVRILRGLERPLGDRDVLRLVHESAEVGGRHGVFVHPEAVDLDAAHRLLLGVEAGIAHVERSAGDVDHARRRCDPR
jgi:hypothetical protein